MTAVTSERVGRAICEALGLDPERVTRVALVAEAGRPLAVEVTGYVPESDEPALVSVIDTFAEDGFRRAVRGNVENRTQTFFIE